MPVSTATELAVVGAGPGGYAAAFHAADLGMKVALVDRDPTLGGVCLNRGCIPSKALLHVAHLLDEAREAESMGVRFGRPRVDVDAVRAWKESVVRRQVEGLAQLARARNVRVVQGEARFLAGRTLEVRRADGEVELLTYDRAILATGSRPAMLPDFDIGDERIVDSTGALALESVPRTMLVVGGGYIGLELGSVYAALGARVTVVEMMPGLLPGADRDLVRVLEKRLAPRFEAVLVNTRVTAVRALKSGIRVTFEGAEAPRDTFERVLVSVGRRPNSSDLGLENTAVEVDERGFVRVDASRRTAEPTIWAIGDVTGGAMLAHKAAHEARVAVEAIAGRPTAFDPAAIPAVIFTDPEIAWAGLTETEAKERGIDVRVARFPWAASGRATTLGRNDGLTKLVVDPKTDRVLGVGIVGTGAGDLVSEGALAIEMAALAGDVAATIHPHPTLSETLMEAAEVYLGSSAHVFRPRR